MILPPCQYLNDSCYRVVMFPNMDGNYLAMHPDDIIHPDEKVVMFPNEDVDRLIKIARWWPETVSKEVLMLDFLEKIGVPTPNRKQAYIAIESTDGVEPYHNLPILISDSFEQDASRGWFIFDIDNKESTVRSNQEKWDLELNSWKSVVAPFIVDIWKLGSNNIQITMDSANMALVETTQDSFELRYFGFDFGGKRGISTPPSLKDAVTTIQWDYNIWGEVSGLSEDMISHFIFDRLKEKWNFQEALDFSNQAGEYFSHYTFFKEAISNIHDSGHDEF